MYWMVCEQNPRKLTDFSSEFAISLIVLHSVTAVPAITLNALVMVTVWKTPSLHTPSRILLCSLAMSDLLIGALVQVCGLIILTAILKTWPMVFCITWVFNSRIGYSLGLISMLTLAAISIDRCLAIKIKTSYRSVVTKKRTTVLLVCIWVLASGVTLSTVHFLHPKQFDMVITVVMVICLLTITVSYSIAFRSLKRLSVQVTNQPSSGQPASDFNVFKYRRSLITMLIVLAATLLLFAPLLLLTFFKSNVPTNVLPSALTLCESLIAINSTLNPLIYLWRMKALRQAAKNLFSCLR